jgi:hypothetical protein
MDFENFPLTKLVNALSKEKAGDTITFDNLREELQKRDGNDNAYYHINLKENEDLGILYYSDLQHLKEVQAGAQAETQDGAQDGAPDGVQDPVQALAQDLEQSCRSLIVDKKTLKPVASQFNKIIYNDDAVEFLQDKDWNSVVVQKCYEGTMLLLFNHNDRWYISTRRCLDAGESVWIKNKSYKEMFDESLGEDFSYDNLDKNLCYHFILVHHQNRNIVSYNDLGKEYKELYHVLTFEKYTFKEVECQIKGVNYIETEHFDNLEQVCEKLDELSKDDEMQHTISNEGYILRVYSDKENLVQLEPFTLLKLQTELYQKIMKMKPNNSNVHQSYLELYQKDKLVDFLPYFTKYNNDIIKRVHTAMKNMAKEILDLYHSTRQKKNPHIYHGLGDQYKKALFELHGIYISHRKQEFKNMPDMSDMSDNSNPNSNPNTLNDNMSKSINVHDVYHYIKSLPTNELRQLFYERTALLENNDNEFLNRNCMYTMTQTTLMFKHKSCNNLNVQT